VVNGLVSRRSGASRRGQVGKHGVGEAGADVPGVPQAAVVGDAEQQRADDALTSPLAQPPAADDDLGV
jgi:hypothetical protein